MDSLRELSVIPFDDPRRPHAVRRVVSEVLMLIDSHPDLSSYFDDLMKYKYRMPNRYFLEALSQLECDFDYRTLLRTIHQQDEDIAFLSDRLNRTEAIVDKYEKLVKKVDWLKRQNKRLTCRNKELVANVY